MQVFKSKELHKVRMLEAEERKSMYEAEQQQSRELSDNCKTQAIERANRKASFLLQRKRDIVTEKLEDWCENMEQCSQTLRDQERQRMRKGRGHWQEMDRKLGKVAEMRHNKTKSMAEQNEQLRKGIQVALRSQVNEERRLLAAERKEAMDARLEAANLRRQQVKRGTTYDFLEQAFGAQAVGFDAKHHSVAVDRRNPSWQTNAKSWASLSCTTFSAPSLGASPPMSPFKADADGYLTADIPLRPLSP